MLTSPFQPLPSQAESEAEDAPAELRDIDIRTDVEKLHDKCGVYTAPAVVEDILDRVGWRDDLDMAGFRLLEPAAGDGAFLGEAAVRLARSHRRCGRPLNAVTLSDAIVAWELHPGEADKARARVERALVAEGVTVDVARDVASRWVRTGDFLRSSNVERFSHVVGNPPYVRWSKIPPSMKAAYERELPKDVIGGDLLLPFLHLSLSALQEGGSCGILCSDRWKYMAYAEGFRERWLPRLTVQSDAVIDARDAFVRKVDAYASVLVAVRQNEAEKRAAVSKKAGRTLRDAGYVVRVGPALGCTPAFVLGPEEHDVEPELLRPWIDGSDIAEGHVGRSGRRVVTMYDEDGLIDPERYPLLLDRLKRFETVLSSRAIVRAGAKWYRPIDRLRAADWLRPKLVVPELAKVPRLALDLCGAIPSHGVYAIFSPNDDLTDLSERLRDGGLARRLEGTAPLVKGGYVRCYKRFLEQIIL